MLRPLVIGFSSDTMERHYIHRFLPIAEEVVGIQHVHNGFFWSHVIPEYCLMSESVKHACVALSSAFHNIQLVGFRPDTSSPPTKAERYILKHYNQAMTKMSEESTSMPLRKRYGIIMICCVFFFYIEIMRNEWPTAMMHLINGLRLMTNLPDEIEDILRHPDKWSQGHDTTHARAIYMVRLLCRWEVSAGFLAANLRPSLSLRTYEPRKRKCFVPPDVQSLEHLQAIINDFYLDANAFIWLCKQYTGDDSSWDHAAAKVQHDVLQQRSYHFARLLEKTRGSYGDPARTSKASDYLSFQSCLLRHRAAALALALTPLPRMAPYTPPIEETSPFEEIITIVSTIEKALRAAGAGASPWINVDYFVISALYVAAINCRDEPIRGRLFNMILEWPWRENLWDGPWLRQKLQQTEMDRPAVTTLVCRPLI